MKVWLLTSGEYSDYRVDGVFSTPEAAQTTADARHDSMVEEYEIDGEPWQTRHDAHVRVIDGHVEEIRVRASVQALWPRTKLEWTTWKKTQIVCHVTALAETAERATKVAAELAGQVAAEWDLRVAAIREAGRKLG